jgi:hypothetical protein
VQVTAFGFTAPTAHPGSLLLDGSISGSVGPSGSNSNNLLSFTSCVDPSNGTSCSVVGNTLHQNPNITSTFSDTADLLIASLAASFSMIEIFDITIGAGATVSFTATMELTPAPAPLPAALPLFATGVGGLGLLGWRRKRKAQATA